MAPLSEDPSSAASTHKFTNPYKTQNVLAVAKRDPSSSQRFAWGDMSQNSVDNVLGREELVLNLSNLLSFNDTLHPFSPFRGRLSLMDVRVFEAPAGERLDVAISLELETSRTYAKELVNEGYVQLNGKPVAKPATKLSGAELVSVVLPPPKPMMIEPEEVPLDIIYEDDDLIAINKPPGMTAHPHRLPENRHRRQRPFGPRRTRQRALL